jgi:hypothetical protein
MQVDEFIGEMRQFKRTVESDLKEIKTDIKSLNGFKWRAAGGSALLVLILTIAAQAVAALVKK